MPPCSTKLFLAMLMCAMLAACTAPGPGATKLTAKDAGTTVHIQEGGILEVALEGNPTTGYTWESAPDSTELLAAQAEPEFKADSSALGSGGTMTLRFKAVKQGTGALKLIYHRTFEPGVAPLQTYTVNVIVE